MPGSARTAAFFDVDGTLTRSDIFRDLVAFRRSVGRGLPHAAWLSSVPARGLLLLALDKVSRSAVNRLTYSWLAGQRRGDLERWGREFQAGPGLARLHCRGFDLLRAHAARGHRIVFVSGAIDLVLAPLARLLEVRLELPAQAIRVEAVRLGDVDGVLTGALLDPPLGDEEKARRVRQVAAEEGLDLDASHAYGDSWADLPLLAAVGRPAAVNPDWRLRRHARRQGWPVLCLST
jgi:HAD superfamily hydrolase (TIGR01490 family)